LGFGAIGVERGFSVWPVPQKARVAYGVKAGARN